MQTVIVLSGVVAWIAWIVIAGIAIQAVFDALMGDLE